MEKDLKILQPGSPGEHSRRDFLKQIGSTIAGFTIVGFVAPIFEGCSDDSSSTNNTNTGTKITVDVSTLTADNTGLLSRSPSNQDILIVRLSATSYETLLMVCKHQACTPPNLALQVASSKIVCGCHGSEYDIHGKVSKGPAAANLDTYATTYDETTKKVTITF